MAHQSDGGTVAVGDGITIGAISADEAKFTISEIDDATLLRMRKGGSYPEGCPVKIGDLQYVRVLHYGYDGKVHEGELVCNKSIARDLRDIFLELYRNKYPIERMQLIDDYGANDEQSMRANNTSSFCYRVVNGTKVLSKHARGLAIDINPLHNPCVKYSKDGKTIRHLEPNTDEARRYARRSPHLKHMIDKSDLCYRLFIKHGFKWGGAWPSTKDYQHFEK